MAIHDIFLKPYDPKAQEDALYDLWLQNGLFNPDELIKQGFVSENASPYSIVLPPPNVTGNLHMGHASMLAIEDIMIRHARALGKKTLWIPGTDHAAIATQVKVEKILEKEEGKRKHDLGREAFLKKVDAFAAASHDSIVDQVKKMGASVDWSREAFTLDEKRTKAVHTAFKTMYDDGLIYQGDRVINWDPKGQTVISDDEIVYVEQKTKLYTFTYSKNFPIAISTTRPETKVGDVAVAVNSKDERYTKYVGKTFEAVFVDVPISITVIADDAVDPAFGTGAVGVTPAHSHVDYDMSLRHKLPLKQVIDTKAKMMCEGVLKGKKVLEARTEVVTWLKDQGLMQKEEDVTNNLSTAERTGATIEPMPMKQWFVAVNKEFAYPHDSLGFVKKGEKTTLKDLMRKAVHSDAINILPDKFNAVYFNWIDNLRDWCISRQIWYGHRIPMWKKGTELVFGETSPGKDWEQDPDTLDTWFSSGLWTFSTLGWPEKTKDMQYHPTAVLETGSDILFFWVARMILMSTYLVGQVPFKTVYLHGIVRHKDGRKMSKSSGDAMDPLDMIAKYGADATRMSFIVGTGPGNDIKIAEDKIKGYKHFANKLWNIARFIHTAADGIEHAEQTKEDIAIYDEWRLLLTEISKEMNEFKYHLSSEKLYHYTWHRLADEILEKSKPILNTPGKEKDSRAYTLSLILKELLVTLHPYMPFVTEAIWQHIPVYKKEHPYIAIAPWVMK